MIYGAVLLLGILSLQRLKVSLFPDIVFPRLLVLTPYAHAAPEEIENLVSIPIEDAVGSVSGIKKIVSRSEEGLSIVEVSLDWGSSLDLAVINIRQKVDLAKQILPQDTGKSIILKYDPSNDSVITLVARPLSMPFENTRDCIEKNIRPLLERVDGAASLSILGGYKREIHVDVDARRLYSRGLSLDVVSRALTSSNFNFPAGNVRRGDREFTVRVTGEFPNVEEINRTVIFTGENGGLIHLSDIAQVRDDFRERRGSAYYNGEPAVIIGIRKEPGKNTIATAANIRKSVYDINKLYERSLRLDIIQDRSEYISDAIDSVKYSALIGAVIAFAVVYFFLRDLRAALIINISMPMSVISTFILMHLENISINIMSLGGLALGVGMVVDNSIVVLEAISQLRNERPDLSLHESAVAGTRLVWTSMTASTFTSIIVFVPIIFVSGIAGEVFRDLALTVSFSLLSSLACAFTLVPMLSAVDWRSGGLLDRTEFFLNRFLAPVFHGAELMLTAAQNTILSILDKSLRKPGSVLLISISFSAAGLLLFLPLRKSLFPDIDQGIVISETEMPGGTVLSQAENRQARIHEFLLKNRLALHAVTVIGHDEDDISSAVRGVKKPGYAETQYTIDTPRLSSKHFIETVRSALAYENLSMNFRIKGDVLQELLGESAFSLFVDIECADRGAARKAAQSLYDRLRNRPEIISLKSTAFAGSPEIRIHLDRDKLSSFGLTPGGVGDLIRSAVDGSVPTHFREADLEIPVRVRLQEKDRKNTESLHSLYIQTGEKSHTELGNLILTSSGMGHASILRENQRRLERIRIEFVPEQENDLLIYINNIIDKTASEFSSFPAEIRPVLRIVRENQETGESLNSLFYAFALSIVLIYLLLAGQFESLLHPLSLALSIPLMLFGVSASLLLTGNGLNITSGIGMIMLVGIVTNSGVILYEYIQHNRSNDAAADLASLPEIIKRSVKDRIRPILLTTLTTIMGLIPLAIPSGSGGDLQAPMSIAVMGGLTVSTALTMVAFPCVFFLMESSRLRRKLKSDVSSSAADSP